MFWKLSCLLALWTSLGCLQVEGHGYHHVSRRSARKSAPIGGAKILECEIAYPDGEYHEHIIQWRKQGTEVPIFIQFNGYPPHIDAGFEGRITLVEQASIRVQDIRTSDEGWYECSIVFIDGETEEPSVNGTWIYLSVNSPPVLGEVSPSFLIQKEGDTIDMFCEASATPEPSLTWYKDGKLLEEAERVTISGNRVQVRALDRGDGGVYTCTFKNIVGQVSHIIKLVIEECASNTQADCHLIDCSKGDYKSCNAYIMVPPKNTTANEGTRVKLNCQAEGYPNNITYRWFKNGEDVQTVPGLMSRSGIFTDGSFVISTVIKEDTGWYKCRPSNGLGVPPEAEAYLNVTYLPRVLNMPVRIYLPRNMEGHIKCPVEANPPFTLIVWTKNERPIELTHSSRIKVNKDGTLVIRDVDANDEGRYTCTPYSPLGAGRSSSVVQIQVRDPPFFVVRPAQYYQRQPTQGVTMPCVAEGDPKPSVQWRKDDDNFPPQSRIIQEGGNLTIVNLGKEDYGQYECVATNLVTSVITTTLLIIELTTPHAPYNVSVDATMFSARVSWRPAYDGGYPQHYILWYKMNSGVREEWQTLRVLPDDATSLTVYKLFPDTTYQFSILSRNRLGDGLFSKIVTAKTKSTGPTGLPTGEDGSTIIPLFIKNVATPLKTTFSPDIPIISIGPRPDPPTNVTVRRVKDGGLHITWMPPKNTTIPVYYYVVHYRTVGRWVPLTDKIYGKTWFLWKTASMGATYHFQVYSYSQSSHSKGSEPVTFITGDPMTEGVIISNSMIGGIVGGLLFLFVAIILIVIAIKFFNKRRQRERAMRYGNVKYFGPKQVEANKNPNYFSMFSPFTLTRPVLFQPHIYLCLSYRK